MVLCFTHVLLHCLLDLILALNTSYTAAFFVLSCTYLSGARSCSFVISVVCAAVALRLFNAWLCLGIEAIKAMLPS